MDPRISVCNQVFPVSSIEDEIALFRRTGVPQLCLLAPRLETYGFDASVATLKKADLKISAICCPFVFRHALDETAYIPTGQKALDAAIDAAAHLGAPSVYMVTGGRGALSYDEAARTFCEAITPSVARAKAAGIKLMLEPASWTLADVNIVHTLTAATDLAEQAGIGVCIDILWCWTDADLRQAIRRAVPICDLVQVCDYAYGDRAIANRLIPGDGNIPLQQIIGWILEDGYKGDFDLEIQGQKVLDFGVEQAVRLSGERLEALIAR